MSNRPKRPWGSVKCIGTKDGTNLEFHSDRISHRISSKFRIRMEYRIESNKNVQWLQIRLEYLTLSKCLAGTALPASFMRVCFVKFIRLNNASDFNL